jgi:hypothetical protein
MPAYRKAAKTRQRLMLWLSGTSRDGFLDVDRILWVPPSLIEYKTLLKGSTLRNRGCGWVLDGDWDELRHPFANDARYGAVRDVLEDARSWQETDEYAAAVVALDRGESYQYCRTRDELDERYVMLDRVIESIRRDGYRTQDELRRLHAQEGFLGRGDEITVAIGRHGDVLYRDGAHRLAIAMFLEVPRIPVQVVVRHSGWAVLRRDIERYARAHEGLAPQPLLHPDLDNVPSRTSCTVRFEALTASLSQAPGSVIDLTPGWGYFCQRLSLEGFECHAVVWDMDEKDFLRRLCRASAPAVRLTAPELAVLDEERRGGFDVGLMLDGGLPRPEAPSLDELAVLLAVVNVRELRVEPDAFCARLVDRDLPKETDRQAVLGTLLAAGSFAHSERLASSPEAGPLYRLY